MRVWTLLFDVCPGVRPVISRYRQCPQSSVPSHKSDHQGPGCGQKRPRAETFATMVSALWRTRARADLALQCAPSICSRIILENKTKHGILSSIDSEYLSVNICSKHYFITRHKTHWHLTLEWENSTFWLWPTTLLCCAWHVTLFDALPQILMTIIYHFPKNNQVLTILANFDMTALSDASGISSCPDWDAAGVQATVAQIQTRDYSADLLAPAPAFISDSPQSQAQDTGRSGHIFCPLRKILQSNSAKYLSIKLIE